MKKSIFLITLGLFFGLTSLSSCGGGEDEAKAKATADSLAKVKLADSLNNVRVQDSLKNAAIQDSLIAKAKQDSLEGVVNGMKTNKPTTSTKPNTGTPVKIGPTNNATGTTTTTTTTTTTGGKVNVTTPPKTGGKVNVK